MKAITFSDVLIKPQYSEIDSRREIDISSNFGQFKLMVPIFSTNMKTITGPKMAIAIRDCGGIGILHRFCTISQAIEDFKEAALLKKEYRMEKNENYDTGVSIGVQEEDKERFLELYKIGARIFCIDIAHGNSLKMKQTMQWIRSNYSNAYIIAGNIATGEAAEDLVNWGANAIKVGIGGGAACETRKNCGIGVPQLSALQWAREKIDHLDCDVKIISDGGIKNSGDISKALKYSDAVMVGSYIAGTTETPGEVYKDENGFEYKVYMGSASGENKIANGQSNDFVEGIVKKVPFRGHIKYIIKSAQEGVQSAFSYVGARNLKEFQEKCEFIEISGGGKTESKL